MSATNVIAPTCDELFEGRECDFKSVSREADDSWRHGAYVTQVFMRKSDNTFWSVSYRLSTDGEVNELREGTAEVVRVEPHAVTTTVYREWEPGK